MCQIRQLLAVYIVNSKHRSSECQVVTNVASRKGILCKKGVCFVCLRSGHIARNCLSNMKVNWKSRKSGIHGEKMTLKPESLRNISSVETKFLTNLEQEILP